MNLFVLCLLLVQALTGQAAPDKAGPRIELPRADVLIDEPIPIVVTGAAPHATVAVRLRGGPQDQWKSEAIFTADDRGSVDLAHAAPIKGSYKTADPMGLFWSAERGKADDENPSSPEVWTLTAEVDRNAVATAIIRRRAVAEGVRMTPVRVSGLVGTFYEPHDAGHHPAFLVLGGSNGGMPPASGPAGGLASRGYAVLALAYFGMERLPPVLSNIPLEYFGTALQWLSAQPSVDPQRIGVLGASRGAELALLLGAGYPGVHAVVAYMPSNVVWRGCCDPTTQVAWTVGGRPVARAEIPVEKIQGAILLISGRDDGVWASADMAERIVDRLKSRQFAHPYQSLTYDHAGHGITRPYTSTMELNRRHPISGRLVHMGGTPAGTAAAREDSWNKLLEFADRNLRGSTH